MTTDPLLGPEDAVAAAVRIIDDGVDYGAIGIDAPPEVGRRAAELLGPAVERHPDDLRLRCVYSAAISLSGRLSDAREQLGIVLSKDAAYFEAVAELDHPSAWRHVFLSPPWSAQWSQLAPLVRRWLHPSGQLRFISMREGADRVVCLLGTAPPGLPADANQPATAVVLDVTLLTRSAGAFLAMHAGVGGPEPERVQVVDGFEFPWPEGTGFRSELLLRFFLQQDRTYVILARHDGSVALNRPIRFGAEDRERHERFLRRLEAASPRDTDTRLQQQSIARYLEEIPRDAVRKRLSYRIHQGHAPPDQLAAEEPELPAETESTPSETQRIQTVPVAFTGLDVDVEVETQPEAPRRPTLPSARPAAPEPEPELEPMSPDELAARSALAVAGLWPWARRERLLGHGIPLILGAAAVAGALIIAWTGTAGPLRLVAGALLGVACGIVACGVLASRHEQSLRRHLDSLLTAAGGTVTADSLAEAARNRKSGVLPGGSGERLIRRLLRVLEEDSQDSPAGK